MLTGTKSLIEKLQKSLTKTDFDNLITQELDSVLEYLTKRGYSIDKKKGFIGPQILDVNDLFIYSYFRDLHFLFWGFSGDWRTYDTIEETYYNNLKKIATTRKEELK